MRDPHFINMEHHGRINSLMFAEPPGIMYPEFLPPPTDADIELLEKEWPAWLFKQETNYPLTRSNDNDHDH